MKSKASSRRWGRPGSESGRRELAGAWSGRLRPFTSRELDKQKAESGTQEDRKRTASPFLPSWIPY
jgi:hypothetical protein